MPFNIVVQMKLSRKKSTRRQSDNAISFPERAQWPRCYTDRLDISAGTFCSATFHF